MSWRRVAATAGCLTAIAAGAAHAGDDLRGRVVFARGSSLWLTDARGKGPARELAPLPGPASEVRTLRSDADGDTLLVEHGGRWWWTRMPAAGTTATLSALPCGPGPARLSAPGHLVLCAAAAGSALLVRLRDGKLFPRPAPAASATVVERAGSGRELVWVDGTAVVAAPLARPTETRVVAPAPPLRGFLAAPDGSRGVGVYRDRPVKPAGAPERDQLFGFALDGTAARRRLIRDGVVLDWSWDSRWLLVQDGGKACIARATGGQFKCWKGFTAVSLAPDGAWALVLGPRAGADGGGAEDGSGEGGGGEGGSGEGGSGEGGEDEAEADEHAVALPRGPLSLYRAKLNGPYTERPALVETVVDGAALWLPEATATAPTAPTAPTAATASTRP